MTDDSRKERLYGVESILEGETDCRVSFFQHDIGGGWEDRSMSSIGAGDINGDGYDDLAIGVSERSGFGVVEVLYGSERRVKPSDSEPCLHDGRGENLSGTLPHETGPRSSSRKSAMPYQAFLSYSQHDLEFAAGLQRALESFNKPLFKTRSMRVFRDDTDMDASPELWDNIAAALDESSHFLLLASPASASSKWVQREIGHFLSKRDVSNVCIVAVSGRVPWVDKDVNPGGNDSAISAEVFTLLSKRLDQPLVLDMRRYRTKSGGLDRRAADYPNMVASIAAATLGRDKDQLHGEHLGKHRRLKIARVVIACIFVSLISVVGYQVRLYTMLQGRLHENRAVQLMERKLEEDNKTSGLRNANRLLFDLVANPVEPLATLKAVAAATKYVDGPEPDPYAQGLKKVLEGDYERAGKHFEEHRTQLEASLEKNYRMTGEAALRRQDYEQAIGWYKKALEYKPNTSNSLHGMAVCLWRLGQLEEALSYCNGLVDHYDTRVETENIASLTPDLALSLNNRANVLADMGQSDAAMNDFSRAIEYRRVISANAKERKGVRLDELAQSLNNRGVLNADLQRSPEAMFDYDEAVNIRRKLVHDGHEHVRFGLANVLVNRGVEYLQVDDNEAALSDFNTADGTLALRSFAGLDNVRLLRAKMLSNRSIAHRRLGKQSEATTDAKEAGRICLELTRKHDHFELWSLSGRVWNNLGNVYLQGSSLQLADEAYSNAIDAFEHLVEKGKISLVNELATGLCMRALTLQQLGRNDEAIDDAKRASKMAPQGQVKDYADALLEDLRAPSPQ